MIDESNIESFQPACMLFQGAHAHRSHREFADAIGADYRHFETGREPIEGTNQDIHSEFARVRTAWSLSNEYEIVIAEGTAPIQTAIAYRLFGNWGSAALYLAADETFYALDDQLSAMLWSALKPLTSQTLDGVIAVGRDVYEWSTPYLGELDVEIVHPPIDDEKYDLLSALPSTSPQDEFVILSAGTTKPTNNYDELARATERLVNRGVSVQTVILGEDHPDKSYANSDHILTPGFVDLTAFQSFFKQASVYVQPSVGDSFPVAALEGILSGTPTLVTSGVGVRELLPESQVVPPTVGGLADGIERFYEMSVEERRTLGETQRELVSDLTVTNQTKQFRQAVHKLVS